MKRSMLRSALRRHVISPLAALFVLLGCSSIASAQQPPLNDPLLDALVGQWVLRGEIRGMPTTQDVEASWVLNHRFLHVHERSRETTNGGDPQYEADVFIGWDSASGRYIAHWMDVYGGGFSVTGYAAPSATAVPFVFMSGDDRFRTAFVFDARDRTWRWTMDSEHEGQSRPFARLLMTRR